MEHTPWLTARISWISVASESCGAEKWNAAGRRTAMTLIVINDELSCVAPAESKKDAKSVLVCSGAY